MGQSCTKHRSVANGPRTGAGPNQNGKGDKKNKNKTPSAPSTLPSGGYGVRPSTGLSHTSRGLGHSFDGGQGDSTSRGLNESFNTVEGAGSNFAGDGASTHRSTKSSKATKAYMRQQRLDQQVQECIDEIPVITLIATTAVGGQGPTETPVGAPPASAASGAQQGRPPLTNNNQVSRPTLQPPPHQQRAPGKQGSAPNSPGVPTQPSSPQQRAPVVPLAQKSLHQQPQQQQKQQPRQQTMHIPQPRVPGNTHVDRFRQAGLVVQAVQAMSPQRQQQVPKEQRTRPVDTTGEAKLQRLVNSKSLLDFRTLEQEEATDRKFREANQLRILTSMFEQSQSEIEEVLNEKKLHRMREQRYGFTSSGNSSPAGSGNNRLKSQMLVGETPSPRRAPPPPPGPTVRPASSPNTNEGRVRLPLRRPLDPVKPIPGSGRSRTGSPSRSPPTTTIVKDPTSDWERAERREEEEEPRASAWHRQGQRFKEEQRRGVESSEVSKRQSVLHMEAIDHAEIVQKFSASAIDFGASVTRRIHEQKKMMGEAKDKYHFASSEDRGSRGGSITSRAAPHRSAPPPPSSSVHARNDPTWLESHNTNNTSTGFSGGAHLSRNDDSTFASSVGGNTSTWGSAKKPRRAAPTPAADPFSSHYQAEGSATRPTGAAYRR